MMGDFLGALGVGFLGSFHCVGMCGPLVLAYSLSASSHEHRPAWWKKTIFHHLSFHSGRLLTYGFLGALAGGVVYSAEFAPFFQQARGLATLAAGCLMLLFGFILLRIIPFPLGIPGVSGVGYRAMGRLISSHSPFSKLLLGFGAGFLPCMLPWAMLVKAASTSRPLEGFAIMAVFGLGTVPALFFAGVSASLLSVRVRLAGERLAGFSIILMGTILLFKGAKHFF